jgi:hydroxymethylbilane synthase
MQTARSIRLGTRGSNLALRQADCAVAALRQRDAQLRVSVAVISTAGDRALETALSRIGEKALFTKAIDDALRAGAIDIAVHSLKDLPTQLEPGLCLAAVLERETPLDGLLSRSGAGLRDLAPGCRIGTSSLRRRAQVLAVRPDVQVVDLRGNVETRLRKMQDGAADALILACAGLKRLGLDARISEELAPDIMLPAPGQGAIAIECREDDPEMRRLLAHLDDPATRAAVTAERAFLHALQGGCHVPIGCLARRQGDRLQVTGRVCALDGRTVCTRTAAGSPDEAHALGVRLAEALLAHGGRAILEALCH